MNEYKVCTRCVMDTTDPDIEFDVNGVCSHCLKFENETVKRWFPNQVGEKKLSDLMERVKEQGKNRNYDCILGLSGGVDSSFLAVVLKSFGLRPLVVHVDAGWNSELAVKNIQSVVKYCEWDLHTHVIDWKEMRDLQLAYFRSGIANQDVPQDHAFFSSLYRYAVKNKIKYVFSGGNIATESVFPESWHHSAMDAISLRDIHKKFGTIPLKKYKTISFFKLYFYYPILKGMKVIRPLNFMNYNKYSALEFLKSEVGYVEYGRKHGESRFTKFFQNYYLPKKFGIDKRRAHYSSEILSGLITREEAIEKLSEPLYDSKELSQDINYLSKKLRLSEKDFNDILESDNVDYTAYKNWDGRIRALKFAQSIYRKIFKKHLSNYS